MQERELKNIRVGFICDATLLFVVGLVTNLIITNNMVRKQEIVDHNCAYYDKQTAEFTWKNEL